MLKTNRQTRRVLFSGDLGKYDQPIIRDPVAPPACEYLVVESTYGDRLHDPEDPKIALERVIKNAAQHNSEILIPAFAVGRAQELLYLIRELEDEKRVPILPVILDSPMASAATKVYANRREEHDEEYVTASAGNANPMHTHSMTASTSKEESKRLNRRTRCARDYQRFGNDDRRPRVASRLASACRIRMPRLFLSVTRQQERSGAGSRTAKRK